MHMRKLLVPVALLCLSLPVCAETPVNDWKNLEQLRVGERIQVVKKDKSSHNGTFIALSDESLTLRTGHGDTGFRREDVVRVSRVGSARRGRAALIGLAIGGGAGAALGAGANSGAGLEIFSTKEAMAILGVIGGGVGAGIGAAVARPAKTEIYRVTP